MVRLTVYTIGYRVLVMLAMMYYLEPYAETTYVAKIWPREGDIEEELCTDGFPYCE